MTEQAVIDPKIDAYGPDGRSCALADLLEFRALKSISMSKAELADLVVDMNWTSLPTRRILIPSDADTDVPDTVADLAFSLIEQRLEVLGDRYPFELVAGRLTLRTGVEPTASPYIAVLAIAIAHAWKVSCGSVLPEDALEWVVRAAFDRPRGTGSFWMAASGVGTAERGGRKFVDALEHSATSVGLKASPNPRPIHASVRDAGVDTLVNLVWAGDPRPGNWVLVGQATCGMTGTWSSKLTQPSLNHWRGYLQNLLDPRRFLAIPHHVDDRFMYDLHFRNEGVVVDRLRLVLALDLTLGDVRPVVDAVLNSAAA